eukprot:2415344-Pyramimonas_sp.AAC.1
MESVTFPHQKAMDALGSQGWAIARLGLSPGASWPGPGSDKRLARLLDGARGRPGSVRPRS